MIFRLGELFCGPGGLACGARMAGSVRKNDEEYSIAHSKGGRTDISTAALICKSCNSQKGNRE